MSLDTLSMTTKDMQASMIEEMIRRSNIVPDKVAEDVEFYYHVV